MPRVRFFVSFHANCSPDLEVRRRCVRILAEYRPSLWERVKWWAEVLPERWPHFDMVNPRLYSAMQGDDPPILDMIGHETRQELFQWYFQKTYGTTQTGLTYVVGKPDFECYRAASLWYIVDLERAGYTAWEVRKFLDSLVPLEKEWYRTAGQVRP